MEPRDRRLEYMKHREYVRKRDHVEDSTKGNSVYNPITFKRDVPVQVWLESRKLWALSEWLDSKGYNIKFMSEIVKEMIDIIVDNLESNNEIKLSDDVFECRDNLSFRYRISLPIGNERDGTGKGRKGGKNIIHNQLLTERIRDKRAAYAGRYNETPEERDKRLMELGRSYVPLEERNKKLFDETPDSMKIVSPERVNRVIEKEIVNSVDESIDEAAKRIAEKDKLVMDDSAWELPK